LPLIVGQKLQPENKLESLISDFNHENIMKSAGLWLIVAAAGWGIMLAAYTTRARPDPKAPWAHGMLVIGPELPADLAQIGPVIKVVVRLAEAADQTEAIIRGASLIGNSGATELEFQLRPKIILIPMESAGIDSASLQSGRLPKAGRLEFLAGPSAIHRDRLPDDARKLEIVGVLKPGFAPLPDAYLLPASESAESSFTEEGHAYGGTLVQLTEAQSHDRKLLQKLEKELPAKEYKVVGPVDRLQPGTTYLYLGGLAAFLLGGSGILIGLFRGLATIAKRSLIINEDAELDGSGITTARKTRPSWWAAPLLEMDQRPRLVWGVHLVYFGLVIAGAGAVSFVPDVQTILLSSTRQALGASSGPLAQAARAYESGNILRAAAVTFVVNFFLGSLLVLTLPSLIVPGSGIFMAALRGLVWGLLFSPTIGALAYAMLPHSGTMLLEGEGYILATLFGLLIPIHLFQSSLGGTPLSRFGRVLWLNVLANFWVAAVLIIAACYEATEVILMNR
jgi:hypothetical protein